MERKIIGYEPDSLFEYFERISAIPRASGKEEKISAWLCDWAEKRGIRYERDSWNNVIMYADATPGYEDQPTVLLQGHTDMVCEKNGETEHDFDTDPLKLCVRDGILTAEGTTLGGDDGVAVAIMLAVLTEDIPHPRLECLFTSDEEQGMGGAQNFDYAKISAAKLINLDSEEEGVATVSCAGGARIHFSIPIHRTAIPKTGGVLQIKLTGLSGGHSGADIHLGKLSANEAMARLLLRIYEKTPMQLISFRGGSKDNAITRECEAVFYTCHPEEAKEIAKQTEAILRAEAIKEDRGLRIKINKPSEAEFEGMMSFADTTRVLDAVLLAPTGAQTFCPSDRTLTESSANLGVVADEENAVKMIFLARSSVESRMEQLFGKYRRLARLVQAEMKIRDQYPGWEYRRVSPLRDDFLKIAGQVYGDAVTPRATAIHAGLECGFILSAAAHEIDAISIGPNLKNIHTPEESLELASCERLWKTVCLLLARK